MATTADTRSDQLTAAVEPLIATADALNAISARVANPSLSSRLQALSRVTRESARHLLDLVDGLIADQAAAVERAVDVTIERVTERLASDVIDRLTDEPEQCGWRPAHPHRLDDDYCNLPVGHDSHHQHISPRG